MSDRVKELTEKWTKDQIIIALWDLLDNIDTANDLAKDNDKIFRGYANNQLEKRWDLGIESDGYSLYIKGEKLGL